MILWPICYKNLYLLISRWIFKGFLSLSFKIIKKQKIFKYFFKDVSKKFLNYCKVDLNIFLKEGTNSSALNFYSDVAYYFDFTLMWPIILILQWCCLLFWFYSDVAYYFDFTVMWSIILFLQWCGLSFCFYGDVAYYFDFTVMWPIILFL